MAHVIATASLRHLLFTFVSKLRHVSRVRQDSPSTRRGGVRLTSWSTASGSAPAQPARLCGRSAQPTGALPPSSTLGGRSTPRHCAITPAPCPEGACGHGSRPCPRTLQSSSWTVPPFTHCGHGARNKRRNNPSSVTTKIVTWCSAARRSPVPPRSVLERVRSQAPEGRRGESGCESEPADTSDTQRTLRTRKSS